LTGSGLDRVFADVPAPAMVAGVWSMGDVVKIVEDWEAARDGSGA
jgi:hypothetical protein